jgi:hypothetical protein
MLRGEFAAIYQEALESHPSRTENGSGPGTGSGADCGEGERMRFKSKVAALAVVGLVAGLMVPAARAGAPLTIQVGADVPKGFSARVYAPPVDGVPTIAVHEGDVVNLHGGMGLLPVGLGPYEFYSEQGGGIDRPFSFVQSDPDPDVVDPFESEAEVKFNDAFFSVVACGDSATNPCVFDGSNAPLNPGDRESFDGNFFVQIDAEEGETIWGIPAYAPSKDIILRIDVVPNADLVTTQAQVDDAFTRLHDRDVDHARALDAKLIKKATSHKVGNRKVWDAYAGYDTDVLALFAMYPRKIKLNKGDTVRFHFDQLNLEFHSAVFPVEQGLEVAANGFLPVCDPDGDAGPANDNFTVDFETFTCEPGTGNLEVDLTTPMTAEAGNGSFNGNDFENSGLRSQNLPSVPGLAGGGDPWDLKFTKKSNAKGYEYICGFHGREMKGFVVVR